MSRLKSAVSRLESRHPAASDIGRDCSCEWAVEERRAAEIGPEGMAQELRAKLVAAATEWNDPHHPRNSKPEEFRAMALAEHEKRKASLQYWSQSDSASGLCKACPMPENKRQHLALLIEIHELPWRDF